MVGSAYFVKSTPPRAFNVSFRFFVDLFQIYLCLPPTGSGDILFFPVRLSVRLSVRPSVRPSVRHKSCPLYNLKTVKDFSMKLGTLVNHDKTMCHAQEP